jgi:RNA polymerase sigma factor for flagellar operon FliA
MYAEQLDAINRIAESLCRRNGVRDADAEDFVSDVRLKLLQDDYAILRKYRGDSRPTTFLTVVISNLFRDYRIKQWGKWRPSAEAKRKGPVAVVLEAAIYRDGHSFEQACTLIEQDGRMRVDRAELRSVYAALPQRVSRRRDDGASLEEVPALGASDERVLDEERGERLAEAKSALDRAIGRLPPEDRLIVRLHYFEGMSVADVARAVGLPQKPLYPRLKRLLETLSGDLAGQGIGPEYREWLNSAPP